MASNLILRIASELDPKGFTDLKNNLEAIKSTVEGTSTSSQTLADTLKSLQSSAIGKPIAAVSPTDTQNVAEYSKKLNETEKQTRAASAATQDFAVTLRSLTQIVTGAVLTLPMVDYIKGAAESQRATNNLIAQMGVLGESVSRVDFEALATKAAAYAGVTDTQLAKALSNSLFYFKGVENELKFLDTAMGISQVKGMDLATSFQYLGMIQQGYGDRIARRLGITIDKSIKDPLERGADTLQKVIALYEPLAKGTQSAEQSMRSFGATWSNLSEKAAKPLLETLGFLAGMFNKMPAWVKELVVASIGYTTVVLGLTIAINGLAAAYTKLNMAKLATDATGAAGAATKLGGGLAAAGAGMAGLASSFLLTAAIGVTLGSITKIINDISDDWKQQKENIKAAADEEKRYAAAMKASLGDVGKELSMNTDLEEEAIEVRKIQLQLGEQMVAARQKGDKAAEDSAAKEIQTGQQRIQNIEKYIKIKKDLGIATEEDLQKKYEETFKSEEAMSAELAQKRIDDIRSVGQAETEEGKKYIAIYTKQRDDVEKRIRDNSLAYQRDLTNLRVGVMKDGLNKELEAQKLSAIQERQTLDSEYAKHWEYRKALAERGAKEERDIKLKYAQEAADKEIEFALMTADEQAQYLDNQRQAQSILAGNTLETLKDISDQEKEVLKSAAGRKELEVFVKNAVEEEVKAEEDKAKAMKESSFLAQDYALARERAKLATMEEADIGSKITSDGVDAALAYQNQRDAQREKVKLMEQSLATAKEEQGIFDESLRKSSVAGVGEIGVNQSLAQAVTLSQDINITVNPPVDQLAATISVAVAAEFQSQWANFEAELKRQLQP